MTSHGFKKSPVGKPLGDWPGDSRAYLQRAIVDGSKVTSLWKNFDHEEMQYRSGDGLMRPLALASDRNACILKPI